MLTKRNINRYREQYKRWLRGQSDRLLGKPCAHADGKYLDGWYSPNALCPDFLTADAASYLRRTYRDELLAAAQGSFCHPRPVSV